MVGVPGRSKACNTCRQRKIAVRRPFLVCHAQGSHRFEVLMHNVTVSVLSRGPNVRSASSQSGYALDINASGYSLRIRPLSRTVCRRAQRSLFTPQTRAHLSPVGRRVKYYHWSGASRVHVPLQRATPTCNYLLPRMFPSVTRFANSYSASSCTATFPTVLCCHVGVSERIRTHGSC
jgi:hypothetical protein